MPTSFLIILMIRTLQLYETNVGELELLIERSSSLSTLYTFVSYCIILFIVRAWTGDIVHR